MEGIVKLVNGFPRHVSFVYLSRALLAVGRAGGGDGWEVPKLFNAREASMVHSTISCPIEL